MLLIKEKPSILVGKLRWRSCEPWLWIEHKLDGHSTLNVQWYGHNSGLCDNSWHNPYMARTQSACVAVHKTRSTKSIWTKRWRVTPALILTDAPETGCTHQMNLSAGISLHVPNGRRVLVWDHDRFAQILCVEPTTQLAQTSPNCLLNVYLVMFPGWAYCRKTRLEVEPYE